ncbi:MAG: hypothetical protein L0Z73_16000 [Gammaproteobacteria bacterium]|nr:hypothetical protein [Gammaproteobacteria bacterium]
MNKLTIIILLVLMLGGCSNSSNAGKDIEAQLDKAFAALWLADLGLEYPHDQGILDYCVKNNDEACLRAYQQVQGGKKIILETIAQDEALVLRTTLNRIEIKCASEKTEDSIVCTGAVVSLYFFNKDHHQAQILASLRAMSSTSFKRAFSGKYEWMYNRPDPDEWIAFIKSLPDHTMPANEKVPVIRHFEKSKQTFEKFGVML